MEHIPIGIITVSPTCAGGSDGVFVGRIGVAVGAHAGLRVQVAGGAVVGVAFVGVFAVAYRAIAVGVAYPRVGSLYL